MVANVIKGYSASQSRLPRTLEDGVFMAHSLSFMKHYFMFSMNDDIVWRTKSAHFMHVGSLKVSTDDIEESCFAKLFDAV